MQNGIENSFSLISVLFYAVNVHTHARFALANSLNYQDVQPYHLRSLYAINNWLKNILTKREKKRRNDRKIKNFMAMHLEMQYANCTQNEIICSNDKARAYRLHEHFQYIVAVVRVVII